MKKWLKRSLILLCTALLCVVAGAFVGCSDNSSCKHSWDEGELTLEATCTVRGEITHKCKDCGKTKIEYVSPSHKFVDTVTAPTCTEDGFTTHTCENCGHERIDTFVDANGHEYTKSTVKPTCTEDGYDTYTCECGDSYSEISARASGHDTKNAVWTVSGEDELVDEDTCTYERTETAECNSCHKPVEKKYEVVKHEYETSVTEEATCVAVGEKTHTCKHCGHEESEEIAVNAGAHKWIEGSTENGVTTYVCDHDAKHTKKEVSLVTVGNTATVPQEAKTADVELKMENATMQMDETLVGKLTGEVELTAGKHDQTDPVVSSAVANMDDKDKERLGGSQIFSFGLTNDGEPVDFGGGKMTVSVPYELQEGDDPDCIAIWFIDDDGSVDMIAATYANGFATFETEHFSLYTVVRMTAKERCAQYGRHQYTDVVVAPTCTEEGYTLRTCKVCRDTKRENFKPATGHNFKAVVTPSTCSEEGYTTNTCQNCHDVFVSNRTPVLKHVFKDTVVEPTCTMDGYTMHVCELCHKTNVDTYVDKLGHAYAKGKCTVCGARDPNAKGETNNFYVTLFNSLSEKGNQFYVEINDVLIELDMPMFDGETADVERVKMTIVIESGKFTFTLDPNGGIIGKGEMAFTSKRISEESPTGEVYGASMKFVMKDGKVYAAMIENQDGQIGHNYSYEVMDEMNMEDSMTAIMNQILPIVDENMQIIIEKMIRASGSPTEANLKRIIEYFFEKTEMNGGYAFAFNYDVIPEIYSFLTTGTVAELIDVVLGEGKLDATVTWLKGSLDKTLPQIIQEFGVEALKSGLDLEDVYDMIDAILVVAMPKEQTGGKQMTVKELMSAPEFKAMTLRMILDNMMGEDMAGVNHAEMIDGFVAQFKEMPIMQLVQMLGNMGGSGGSSGGVVDGPNYPENGDDGYKEDVEKEEHGMKPISDTVTEEAKDPILALIEEVIAGIKDTLIGFTTDANGNIQGLQINLDIEDFVLSLAPFVVGDMEGVDLSKYDLDAKIDGQGSVQLTFGATYMTEYNEVIAKIQSAKSVFAFNDGQKIESSNGNYGYTVKIVDGVTYIVENNMRRDGHLESLLRDMMWQYVNVGEKFDLGYWVENFKRYGYYDLEQTVVGGKVCWKVTTHRMTTVYRLNKDCGFNFRDNCIGWNEFYLSVDRIYAVSDCWFTYEEKSDKYYNEFNVVMVKSEVDWNQTLKWDKVEEDYGFNFYYNQATNKYRADEPHKWTLNAAKSYVAQNCGEWSYDYYVCSVCGEARIEYTDYKDHQYVYRFELKAGSSDCEDGVWYIVECKVCDYERRDSHEAEEGDHPLNAYDYYIGESNCGKNYLKYGQCPCGKEGDYGYAHSPQITGNCKFDGELVEQAKTKLIGAVTVYNYSSYAYTCAVLGCDEVFLVEEWYVLDGCDSTEYVRYNFNLKWVNGELVDDEKTTKTFSWAGDRMHELDWTYLQDTVKGLEHVEKGTCVRCQEVDYHRGWTYDEYGREIRFWDYLENWGYIYDYDGCYLTAYEMNPDGSRGEKIDSGYAHRVQHIYMGQSCTQYEYEMSYCEICHETFDHSWWSEPSGHDFEWNEEIERWVCTRCEMESINSASGSFYLEDLTEEKGNVDETVVGFFNRGLEDWRFTVIVNFDPLNDVAGVELYDFDGYDVVYNTQGDKFHWANVRCGMVKVNNNDVAKAIEECAELDGVTVESVSLVFEYYEEVYNDQSGEWERVVFFESVTIPVEVARD